MKNKKQKIGTLLLIVITNVGLLSSKALAQNINSFNVKSFLTTTGQEKQPFDIGSYLVRIINLLSQLIGAVAFLALVIAGIILLTSGGSETQLTKGKDIIKYAIIGLVVALAAYFITAFVQSIFYEYGK